MLLSPTIIIIMSDKSRYSSETEVRKTMMWWWCKNLPSLYLLACYAGSTHLNHKIMFFLSSCIMHHGRAMIDGHDNKPTQAVSGPPGNPALFPVVMLGMAGVLGGLLYYGGVETILVRALSSSNSNNIASPSSLCTVAGYLSVTSAHGYAMVYQGNARRIFNVPHPTECDDVPYRNAIRGYYNLVEHFAFFLFNYLLAQEHSPCTAGLLAVVFGVGRILYTRGYAVDGPRGRKTGFMIATFASMACLGVGICDHLLLQRS